MNETNPPAADAASQEIARALQGVAAAAFIESLPPTEQRIATLAREGRPIWEIAHDVGMSDEAAARLLDGVVAAVTGRERTPVETGGLGSDTDPGVSGGYGDTGFGALDVEPIPNNTEPPLASGG
ncbi:MAG TPA: hypothetical protein VFQ80_02160 [Thermomicrobiales bacterium]|jgi:hypothetical protein|nr:hypothetical protein [Thermomicrobiales bacterium]